MCILKQLNITEAELSLVQQYCAKVDAESDLGFDYAGTWITNIFLDSTGRFEINLAEAIQLYGVDNIKNFVYSII